MLFLMQELVKVQEYKFNYYCTEGKKNEQRVLYRDTYRTEVWAYRCSPIADNKISDTKKSEM